MERSTVKTNEKSNSVKEKIRELSEEELAHVVGGYQGCEIFLDDIPKSHARKEKSDA